MENLCDNMDSHCKYTTSAVFIFNGCSYKYYNASAVFAKFFYTFYTYMYEIYPTEQSKQALTVTK